MPPLSVNFANLSPLGYAFTWNYGDNSPEFAGYNSPAHTYTAIGDYPITLSASGSSGCTYSLTKHISVGQPIVDAVLTDVSGIQNGNYYKVIISIFNNSNASIHSMDLTAKLGSGTLIRETWNGLLLSNQAMSYTFSGEFKYNENIDIPVICANIETINSDATDIDISNNTKCKDIKVGELGILTVYPNPTNGIVKLGIMFPDTSSYSLTIYNELAQSIKTIQQNSFKGYNLIDIDLSNFPATIYMIELRVGDKIFRKRVLKK
jgi:PKD repeat protein